MAKPEIDGESLTIGIVTYNNARIIENTVRSVLGGLPQKIPARVFILDNCSTDHTLAIVQSMAAADPRLSVSRNERNAGFGTGHNLILKRVDSSYHVVCNPDINLTAGALDALLDFMRSQPDVGIACPRFHYQDGRLQPQNKLNPTILDLLLRRFMRGPLRRLARTRMERYEMLDVGYDRPYDVPFVPGPFMVCRTDVVKHVGGFDEGYFLYLEDADLGRMVQVNGWRTLYCPDAVVIHGWQRDNHKSLKAAWILSRSAIHYFNKWGWKFY